MAKNLQERIVTQAKKYPNIKITDIEIPPQGMASQASFIKSAEDREYAIKYYARNISGDIIAPKLLGENKIDIPVPKILGVFESENGQAIIMEKIDSSLLEPVPVSEMSRCIPSMVRNLKKIHKIKSDKAGFLTNIDGGLSWKDVFLFRKSKGIWRSCTGFLRS